MSPGVHRLSLCFEDTVNESEILEGLFDSIGRWLERERKIFFVERESDEGEERRRTLALEDGRGERRIRGSREGAWTEVSSLLDLANVNR